MKKVLAGVLAVFFAMGGIAAAAEMEGTIQSVDPVNKEIVLQDGTTLTWDESPAINVEGKEGRLEDLKEGAKVKARFEEKDGKNVVMSVEVGQ